MNLRLSFWLYFFPGMVMAAAGLLMLLNPDIPLPGTAERIAARQRSLNRTLSAIEKVSEENRRLLAEVAPMERICSGALSNSADAAMIFREKLDQAAGKSGVTIRSIGEINRREIIPDELVIFEVDFAAECLLEELTVFANELYENTPRVYWKSLTVKPNTGPQSGMLILSGTVNLLVLGGVE